MPFPSSYDTDDDLFGDVLDQQSVTLTQAVNSSQTTFYVDNADLPLPNFLLVDSELVKVTAKNVGSRTLTVTRGWGDTTAASHSNGATAYLVVTAGHFNTLKDRIIATQKAGGLVGLDSDKPSNPSVGEVYVATDTQKVYVCLQAGSWTVLFGHTTHAGILGGSTSDDHPQYHTYDRLVTWHNSKSGGHVQDGDNHDHSKGTGIRRVRSGLKSDMGTAGGDGYCYYATDTKEFYVASGTTWVQVTGAPQGLVVMFDSTGLENYGSSCPPGWTRETSLDGRLPKGAPADVSSPLNTGGSSSHTHTYSQVPSHRHYIPAASGTTTSNGDHKHSISYTQSEYIYSGVQLAAGNVGITGLTSGSGGHTHTGTLNGGTSGAAMLSGNGSVGSSGTTSASSNFPEYVEVVFCRKQ